MLKFLNDGYNVRYISQRDYERAMYEISDLTDIKLIMRKIGRWREIPNNVSSLVIIDHRFPFYNRYDDARGTFNHQLVIKIMANDNCYKSITLYDNTTEGEEMIDFVLSYVSISATVQEINKYDYMNKYYKKEANEQVKKYISSNASLASKEEIL